MKNIQNKNAPPSGNIIQTYLGSAWDIVVDVYNALSEIQTVANAVDNGDLGNFLTPEQIDTLSELNAILTDANLGDIGDFATAAEGALATTAIQGPFASQGEAEAGVDNTKAMTSLRVAQALAALGAGLQNNFNASTDPGVNDDSGAGYSPGSVWINTTASPNEAYRCSDATVGAAVWIKTTLTADELATVAISGDSDDLTEGVVQLLLTVAERAKLAAIEASATADQTGAEISSLLYAETDTNKLTDALLTLLQSVETGATADQSDAEIETAYNNQVSAASQVEAEAGISTDIRRWSPLRVAQAIAALGGGGGGIAWTGSSITKAVTTGTGTIFHDLAATVTATLPTSPAINHVVWLSNNDDSGNDVTIQAGGSNEIHEITQLFTPTVTLLPGEACFLVCTAAGTPNVWELVRFSNAGNSGVGKQQEYVDVASRRLVEWTCGAPVKQNASGNNAHPYYYMAFGGTAQEIAAIKLKFPERWDAGDIKARFYWIDTAATSGQTVIWAIASYAVNDGEALTATATNDDAVTDTTQGNATFLHISDWTPVHTPAGTAIKGDMIDLIIYRNGAVDTNNGTIRLIGVEFEWVSDAGNDA